MCINYLTKYFNTGLKKVALRGKCFKKFKNSFCIVAFGFTKIMHCS